MTDKSKAQQEWDELRYDTAAKYIGVAAGRLDVLEHEYEVDCANAFLAGVRFTLNNLDKVPKVAELFELAELALTHMNNCECSCMDKRGMLDALAKFKDLE